MTVLQKGGKKQHKVMNDTKFKISTKYIKKKKKANK